MALYGIGLLIFITGCVWFTLRLFTREGQASQGIQAALKVGIFLYPLGIGTLILGAGKNLMPLIFWKLYLLAAAGWTCWIALAPSSFGTRRALSNPAFRSNPMLSFLLFGAVLGIFLPAIIRLVQYVF